MVEPGLIVGFIKSALNAILPGAKRLRDERRAGRDPNDVSPDVSDGVFEPTLVRLRSQDLNEEFFHTIFQLTGGILVRPEQLQHPSIRSWLAEEDVAANLKTIARLQMSGAQSESFELEWKQLQDSYSGYLAPDTAPADEIIDNVLKVMIAGAKSSLSSEGKVTVSILQTINASSSDQFALVQAEVEKISDKLTHLEHDELRPDPVHTSAAKEALAFIIRTRIAALTSNRQEIKALVDRLENGDLAGADTDTRADIYYWAARLHATDADNQIVAGEFLAKLQTANSNYDTTIPNAWLLYYSGKYKEAISTLKSARNADANSSVFQLIRLESDVEDALDWVALEQKGKDTFTSFGWGVIIQCLAEAGRWEEACQFADRLEQMDYDGCFGLAHIAGAVFASQLMPKEFKQLIFELRMVGLEQHLLEGVEIEESRQTAIRVLGIFIDQSLSLGFDSHIDAAIRLQSWLRLIGVDSRSAEIEKIKTRISTNHGLVQYYDIAEAFDIGFSVDRLRQHLKAQKVSGGLSPLELGVEVQLNRKQLTPREFIQFLEANRDELFNSLPQGVFQSLLFDALLEDDQILRAESLFDEMKGQFDKENLERIRLSLENKRGADLSIPLRSQFEATNAQIDLENLVNCLRRAEDWENLLPLQKLLFRDFERNGRNAQRVCDCLRKLARSQEIVNFLETIADLLVIDSDLSSELAWAQFQVGNLVEAKSKNDELVTLRSEYQDLRLSLLICLFDGRWEEFAPLVRKTESDIDDLKPNELLELSNFAAKADKDLALRLIDRATAAEIDTPQLLLSAYMFLISLGEDAKAAPLFARALELPHDDELLKQASMEEVVNWVPERVGRIDRATKMFNAAEIPIHLFASSVNARLSQILIQRADSNFDASDPRTLVSIPVRSGQPKALPSIGNGVITLDISSVMVLLQLDALESVIDGFSKILLPISTMPFLLEEMRRAQFHQPSLIHTAKEEKVFCMQANVRVIDPDAKERSPNIDDIPADIFALLLEAQKTDGKVVVNLPVYAAGSYLEDIVDFGEYAEFILSEIQLCNILHDRALLDQRDYDSATSYFNARNDCEAPGNEELSSGPIFIDNLALDDLQHAGLLTALASLSVPLYLHRDTQKNIDNLANLDPDNAIVNNKLDHIRKSLRDGIVSGKITLLPMDQKIGSSDEERAPLEDSPTLANLFEDLGNPDLVVIDDRSFDCNSTITDRSGASAPVLTSIDLLKIMEVAGVLDRTELNRIRNKARRMGFVFVPLDPEEVSQYLERVKIDTATGRIKENSELRTIREYHDQILASDITIRPEELTYLTNQIGSTAHKIREIWLDQNIPENVAVANCTWLLEVLFPTSPNWAEKFNQKSNTNLEFYDSTVEDHILLLLGVSLHLTDNRREAFNSWMEACVFQFSGFPPSIVGALASRLKSACLEQIDTQKFEGVTRQEVASYFINSFPDTICNQMKSDNEFNSEIGIRSIRVVNYTDKLSFESVKFLDSIRESYVEQKPVALTTSDGGQAFVETSEDNIDVKLVDDPSHALSLRRQEFSLILPDATGRLQALENITEEMGCTGPEFSAWSDLLQQSPLNEDQYYKFLAEIPNSVPAMRDRLSSALTDNKILLSDLVPIDQDYYRRLVGPETDNEILETYVSNQLNSHRKALMGRSPIEAMQLFAGMNFQQELSPVGLCKSFTDGDKSKLVALLLNEKSPFSTLTALELLFSDTPVDLADAAKIKSLVEKLCEEKIVLSGGADAYLVLAGLIDLVFSSMSELEWVRDTSVSWRIMCAFAQANQILIVLSEFEVNEEVCLTFLNQFKSVSHKIIAIHESRVDRNWLIHNLSAPFLRGYILNRLGALIEENADALNDEVKTTFEDALSRFAKAPGSMFLAVPLAIEGNGTQNSRQEVSHTDEQIAEIKSDLEASLAGQRWSWEALCMQLYKYEPALVALIRDALEAVPADLLEEECVKAVQNLKFLAYLAARTCDIELAESVARKCVDLVPVVPDSSLAAELIVVLAIGASARSDHVEWVNWLERWCLACVYHMKRGEACAGGYEALKMLRSRSYLKDGQLARAEALARLGR